MWSSPSRPRADRIGPPLSLASTAELLHQLVQILLPREERLDADTLILAVCAHIENVISEPRMPVGGDAGVAQVETVGCSGRHDRQHGDARPESGSQLLDG